MLKYKKRIINYGREEFDMPEKMPLDRGALMIIERLRKSGFEANVVGGAVRNHILGIPVSDIDMTTSATPDVTSALFSDLRVIETGIKHGTVTVLVDGEPYEITTYRTDGDYLDNRHPECVKFTPNLSEDLARRDFTVNAIAYNPYDGFTDLYDGISDIRNRVIRAVGDPETRFREDALRILRAIRFASVLGFTVEGNTASAVRKTAHLLDNVSRERVFVEWKKLVGGDSAYDVIAEYPDVISIAIPQLTSIRLPKRELFDSANEFVRSMALFYLSSVDSVKSFESAMTALRTDNKYKRTGVNALRIVCEYDLTDPVDIRLCAYRNNTDSAFFAIQLAYTVGKLDAAEYSAALDVLQNRKLESVADLDIGGVDLITLGVRGPAVGKMLDALALAVIKGECDNRHDELLSYLKNHIIAG